MKLQPTLLLSIACAVAAPAPAPARLARDDAPSLSPRDSAMLALRDGALPVLSKRGPRCPSGQTAVQNDATINPGGCGPGAIDWMVPELSFGECCGDHDRCYATCSRTKGGCDSDFKTCMQNVCEDANIFIRPVCYSAVGIYYTAVSGLGDSAFDSATEDHCNCV